MKKFSIFNFQFSRKSFTLVEVLIGVFLLLVIFLGIFGAYQLGLKVISQSKNKVIAVAIASGEIEKIRTLPYSSVGVIGGFPDGAIEPSKIVVSNGVEYTVEVRIDYVVDAGDGISLPEDECPNDYKKAEIKVSWSGLFSGEAILTTDISPDSLVQECAETGGILSVSVFDAFGMMVPAPLIEVRDPETDTLIKSATPFEGQHFFSLSPAEYKVVVSKSGYSSSRTYGIGEVAVPEKPHPLVLDGALTENSFSIDKVSSFTVVTLSPWVLDYFTDSFTDQSQIQELADIVVTAGEAVLEEELPGQYKSSGYLVSLDIAPTNLINWEEFSWNDNEPSNTQILYQVLYFNGADWVLIPDVDLTGNSVGFALSPVDLSGLNTSAYPRLRIKANFSTNDSQVTPVLYDWQVSWKESGATPISNVLFNLQGEKIIGLDQDENPVYKYSQDHNSGAGGIIDISGLEWDSYTFSILSDDLDLAQIDPSPQPIGLVPDTLLMVYMYLEAQNSLLFTVQDVDTGEPVFSADVRLYNSGLGYDETQYTDENGQTYFIPLDSAVYDIEVQAPGYGDYYSSISVSGDKTKIVNLERIE